MIASKIFIVFYKYNVLYFLFSCQMNTNRLNRNYQSVCPVTLFRDLQPRSSTMTLCFSKSQLNYMCQSYPLLPLRGVLNQDFKLAFYLNSTYGFSLRLNTQVKAEVKQLVKPKNQRLQSSHLLMRLCFPIGSSNKLYMNTCNQGLKWK